MIIQQIRSIKSEKKELRSFAVTMAIVLAIVASFLVWRGRDFYIYFYLVGVVFLLFGFTLPAVLKPVHKAWMTLAVILGWVMTRVILLVLFYLVFTPIGLLARLTGKKFLNTRFDKNTTSYWVTRESTLSTRSDCERQF